MNEYERESNVNTPEYWNSAWSRSPMAGEAKNPVRERIVEMLDGLPKARVVEYGFGSTHLARMIGRDRWEGRDFSESAVKTARAEGFSAYVTRCSESPGYRKAFLVAVEVLEHLSAEEMQAFLDQSKNAPHAFFSVPIETERDAKFHQHQRGFGRPDDFAAFLREWWPHVEVEPIGHWMLAHCSTRAIQKPPILTVGSSTLLDFYGVRYTFASLQAHHGTFDGEVEYVLVDNHPEPTERLTRCRECHEIGKAGPTCQTCAKNVADMEAVATREGVRYIRWAEKQGTYPGKNQLQVEARGKWVLTMDSHVLLTPRTIETVLDVIKANPESDDFFHFPCRFRGASGRSVSVDFRNQNYIYHGGDKDQRGGVYGWTRNAVTPGEPYPIAAMITSCYLVRRAAWLSARGYDPILGNYGGWEGPLQLKWWLMGRRVMSLRHPTRERMESSPEGFLFHDHLFCEPGKILANETGRVHTGRTKQRNFAASSAVIGGEKWVRRHCEFKGWNFKQANIQEGMAEGLKLRPWMVENLARPEWEDITKFFEWMKAEEIPGHLERW